MLSTDRQWAPACFWHTFPSHLRLTVCSPLFLFFLFSFLGVHPSWVSCCRRGDAITGRPSSLEARRTGWGWPAARLTETAQWGRTTCHGVCSVCQHHRGKCEKTSYTSIPLESPSTFALFCLSSCRYQLLHRNIRSSVFVTEVPERVGTLLDYQCGRLAFYNAQSGQLLGSFSQNFTEPCHAVLALEMAGSLAISMVPEVPEFTGHR